MNRLKQLAKELVWTQKESEKENVHKWERDGAKHRVNIIRTLVTAEGHDVAVFNRYVEEYRNVSNAD